MLNKMIKTFGFEEDEITQGLKKKLLLSLEIEFSSRCNLRCVYCYSGKTLFRDKELELEEIFDVISQAKVLGVKKIIYLGAGEPLLDPKLIKVIKYVHKLNLDHILFTNGTLINFELAKLFYDYNVTVVVKYKSQKEDVYEFLSGSPRSYKAMLRGLDFLFRIGYPNKDHVLAIESVICKQNIKELPDIWIWAREREILPYIECLTHIGLAENCDDIMPSKKEIKELFEKFAKIDQEQYDLIWQSHPPIAGFSCKRHLYSCTVTSQGFVLPCVGLDLKLGNIRDENLETILKNSKIRKKLVNIKDTIKGKCKECDLMDQCYGCRANAYNLTKDYLESDSTCWRN